MKWWIKIAGFQTLSLVPGGSQLYRWAQENLTGSIVPTVERVRQKLGVGLGYWEVLRSVRLEDRLLRGRHLDLGSGWHPTIPLLFHALGCPEQILTDVVPVMTRETARQTSSTFLQVLPSATSSLSLRSDRLRQLESYGWPSWPPRELGWEYHAPYMDWLASQNSTLDLVTSTQALLHVPPATIREIFRLVVRALKPGAVFMATIHLRDLFADGDSSITPYNHLQYSPRFWGRCINSPLMSYNRLKAPDYRALLEEAGLRLLSFEVEPGQPALLEKIRIHPSFAGYSREDLAAHHLFFSGQKP
jgi:SAM-dependent methyltransferase